MATAFVQGKGGSSASGTTQAVTMNSAVTSGSVLVGFVIWFSNTTTLDSVSDGTNTYTIVDNPTGVSTAARAALFYVENAANTTPTITATFSASVNKGMAVHEISGVPTSGALDQHRINGQSFPGAANVTSNSVTTTTDGQYIFGASGNVNSRSYTAGSGYTNQVTVGVVAQSEDQIQT